MVVPVFAKNVLFPFAPGRDRASLQARFLARFASTAQRVEQDAQMLLALQNSRGQVERRGIAIRPCLCHADLAIGAKAILRPVGVGNTI
jgi:hypothetical protein